VEPCAILSCASCRTRTSLYGSPSGSGFAAPGTTVGRVSSMANGEARSPPGSRSSPGSLTVTTTGGSAAAGAMIFGGGVAAAGGGAGGGGDTGSAAGGGATAAAGGAPAGLALNSPTTGEAPITGGGTLPGGPTTRAGGATGNPASAAASSFRSAIEPTISPETPAGSGFGLALATLKGFGRRRGTGGDTTRGPASGGRVPNIPEKSPFPSAGGLAAADAASAAATSARTRLLTAPSFPGESRCAGFPPPADRREP